MARAGLRRGHVDSGKSPSVSREVLPKRMHQARYWVCQESVHEESHGIGPTPIMCRMPVASVKATRRIPAFPHNGQHFAPQGGSAADTAGQVWVNTRSGKYWKPGSRYYGTTKQGQYMSEKEAVQKGYRPANGTGE